MYAPVLGGVKLVAKRPWESVIVVAMMLYEPPLVVYSSRIIAAANGVLSVWFVSVPETVTDWLDVEGEGLTVRLIVVLTNVTSLTSTVPLLLC